MNKVDDLLKLLRELNIYFIFDNHRVLLTGLIRGDKLYKISSYCQAVGFRLISNEEEDLQIQFT